MDPLKKVKDQTQIVNVNDDFEDKLLHSKERELFRKTYKKRLDKIFTILSTGKTIDFSNKNDPLTFLKKIKKRKITIKQAKELQKDFDKYLKIVRKGNKNHEQQKTLANLNMFFNGRNEAINFISGYDSMILEAKKMAVE